MKFSELSNRVIGCAIEVHKALGPGLLESTYYFTIKKTHHEEHEGHEE